MPEFFSCKYLKFKEELFALGFKLLSYQATKTLADNEDPIIIMEKIKVTAAYHERQITEVIYNKQTQQLTISFSFSGRHHFTI